MPWIVGIDEAGYGPNLGPLVMTAVACRVPAEPADVWQLLSAAVRRADEAADGRLPVGDSKQIYSPGRGLRMLETVVHAALSPCRPEPLATLADAAAYLAPACVEELRSEGWYTGGTALPGSVDADSCRDAAQRYADATRNAGVSWGLVRSVVVCPTRFNVITERAGSKGAVLAHGLTTLLRTACEALPGDEAVSVFVDKHGGRNNYAAMLQTVFDRGFVVAREETALRSVYQMAGAVRPVRVTFQPRADADHYTVALASMVSKYLRELFMAEFNRFWQTHVPGLKPTAGYPVDAVRFYEAIRPACDKLGIPKEAVWRKK
jgi:ribonuclease HII